MTAGPGRDARRSADYWVGRLMTTLDFLLIDGADARGLAESTLRELREDLAQGELAGGILPDAIAREVRRNLSGGAEA